MEDLIEQYTNADEDLRLVRQNITRLEFDTTKHVLGNYIRPESRLTELGAATGRYSLHYAGEGHNVTAVELAPDQVEILTGKALDQKLKLNIFEGNAASVPFIPSGSQDTVLILGPLYHMTRKADRESALSEAHRILKPGGIVAIAYISRFFVAGLFAQCFPELITPDVMEELLQSGTVSDNRADSFFKVGYFSTPDEIENLSVKAGFSLEKHISTDGFGRYIASGINSFTETQYQIWLLNHLATCEERTLLGSSNHGLVVARK